MSRNKGRYSALLDPIMLVSDTANSQKTVWTHLDGLDWTNLAINMIIPITVFLFICFQLRSRYDKKRELYKEYLVSI